MSPFFQAYGLVQNLNGKLCLDTLQRLENKGIVNLGVWECQIEGSSSQVNFCLRAKLLKETGPKINFCFRSGFKGSS
uniref:Uncharacterized protein n=1 Tax=Meloidogyne enterolobii TaxID=390850 RepID=A0A6V7V7U1_MELEN|nr:unnamed protein product [Meloidogyne enterolobii]